MDLQIFVINSDDGVYGIYTNLDKAKQELINIYKKIPIDFIYSDYKINMYKLVSQEYVITDMYYMYNSGKFKLYSNKL